MIQCPAILIDWWNDFQGEEVLFLVHADGLSLVTSMRLVSTHQIRPSLNTVISPDCRYHANLFVSEINGSCDQISLLELMAMCVARSTRDSARCASRIETTPNLELLRYVANLGEVFEPFLRDTIVSEDGHVEMVCGKAVVV